MSAPFAWHDGRGGLYQEADHAPRGRTVRPLYTAAPDDALTAAYADGRADQLADMQPVVEAAKLALATLDDERIGTCHYMEGVDIYADFRKAADAIRTALANLSPNPAGEA